MAELTLEQSKNRIAELQAELDRLKTSVRLTMHGATAGAAPAGGSSTGTVMGVEEMILHVGADKAVGFLNPPMAKLLQVKDRKAALGTPLADLLRTVRTAPGQFYLDALQATVDSAFATQQTCVVESVFPELPLALLPELQTGRPKCDPILRLIATPVKGAVQVSAQDVTYIRWLESSFSRYVSPTVIEQLRNTHVDQLMATRRCEITVLFADLRGFTAMCERMDPEGVRDTINSFLTGMVGCIEQCNGTIDKFVGDEIMALFGAPLHNPNHALSAALAALEMQKRHAAWIQDRSWKNLPAPPMGIGIASGSAVVGNIGTPTRMDFTALGSTINLGARLCGKAEGGEILAEKNAYSLVVEGAKRWASPEPLPHIRFAKKGLMEFKNIAAKVDVISISAGA